MTLEMAIDIIHDSGLYTLEEIRRMNMDRIMNLAHQLIFPTVIPITY